MANRSTNLCWLGTAAILFYWWTIRLAFGAQVNITVDDTDPSISYQPSKSWRASSIVCSECLNPGTMNAYQNTYHDGTHIAYKKNTPVTARFNFTGSAVYLHCILPLGGSLSDSAPTTTNLSFTLDNAPSGTFFHNGSTSASGYLPGATVFAQHNLTEARHDLRVNVEVGSVFLFDYLIYTRTEEDAPQSSHLAIAISQNSTHAVDANTRRHNIATFAGAVGGSVGVLSAFALGLAGSIIRRRRHSAQRERLSRSQAAGSEDSSHMSGPAPFIPRFFPDTQVPSDPPPYAESAPNSSLPSHHGTLMPSTLSVPASSSAHLAQPRALSYADVPPASPPPPLDDTPPPPPFGMAIAVPLSITLPDTLSPTNNEATNETSYDLRESDGNSALTITRLSSPS